MRAGKATLADVARRAGVHKATASRAISAPGLISPATTARVRAAMAELGYVSNGVARALATRRTRTIGSIIPTLDNAIYAVSTNSLERRLEQSGYVLLVACHEFNLESEALALEAMLDRGVDGVVLVGHEHTRATLTRLRKSGVPHVFTWSRAKPGRPTVGFDNRRAGRIVAEHLLALGHRRVGMVAGLIAGNDRASARLAGVRDALAAAGLAMPESAVVERPYSLEAGADGFASLMGARRPPTAIVCGNDVLALGAICEARARGIAVPADVSITGFDDMPMARVAAPRLTTVRFPMREIGWNAGELLLGLLGEEVATVERELPIELAVRESTAPPRR
ncbi:MAG TPA: LacI family DNA-binding transcriptional regulator [Gemmatimonadales bacterium]|nr:LacI family DNA-binding transcriptional regulator [Gemmatimonadales bacterium]